MAGNPLIAQGTLNRLRGSFLVPSFSQLNVTASYLGKGGISLALQGDATTYIETLTGGVTSPQPYMVCMVTLNLLKTQGLADLYKQQMESLSTIGDVTVRGDASTLGDYPVTNCGIQTVRELPMSGEDAGFVVTVKGYYAINSQLWNLV